MNRKLNSKTLDLLETRFINGCLGDVEVSGSVLEILRRVLDVNARLTSSLTESAPVGPASSLSTPGGSEENENMPDYGGKVLNFK